MTMAVPRLDMVGGLKFPMVGLGTFTVTDEKDLTNALNTALEIGYRHIDTAWIYKNEHIIGKVLKEWFDSGKLKREDIFVTTKLPGEGLHPDKFEKYLDESLKALQLDYVDLYLIHFPIHTSPWTPGSSMEPLPTDHLATWKKLEEQVDLGRIKAIGISNFNKAQIERIIKNSRIKPASNQVELHVYLQQPELVKYCQDNGLVVVSYFSLGNPGLKDWLKKRGMPAREERPNLLHDPVVEQTAKKYNKSAAQVLLRFLTQKNIAVIPKSVTPSRIKDNLNLFDFTISDSDMKVLEGLDKGEKGRMSKMDFNKDLLKHPEYPFSTES